VRPFFRPSDFAFGMPNLQEELAGSAYRPDPMPVD
jgi:hypothetical protein